jgi:hypothetical protein
MGVQRLDKVPVRATSVQAQTLSFGHRYTVTTFDISACVHERVGHLVPGVVSANCMSTHDVMMGNRGGMSSVHATCVACVSERAILD